MVQNQLAFGILQLVALSLPAFAILLQMVVESDFPYTKAAVPITTASLGLFLVAGLIILGEMVVVTGSPIVRVALGILGAGMVGMLIGVSLIGVQTQEAQQEVDDAEE